MRRSRFPAPLPATPPASSILSSMIADGTVTSSDLATAVVNSLGPALGSAGRIPVDTQRLTAEHALTGGTASAETTFTPVQLSQHGTAGVCFEYQSMVRILGKNATDTARLRLRMGVTAVALASRALLADLTAVEYTVGDLIEFYFRAVARTSSSATGTCDIVGYGRCVARSVNVPFELPDVLLNQTAFPLIAPSCIFSSSNVANIARLVSAKLDIFSVPA